MADWNVVAKLKIMPVDVETDLKGIGEEIRKVTGTKTQLHSMGERPIAFGLKALEVNILLNDKQGGMEEVEEAIRKIKGVGEVEVTDLNRL